MNARTFRQLCALTALTLASLCAHAQFHTLAGTSFDLTYDETKLGLFGTPTLTGDVISFTMNGFKAESLNGQGLVTTNSTITGLTLHAKEGFTFGQILLGEFGDYSLSGANSSVGVSGQLRAFDVDNSLNTQTTANLVLNPLLPTNVNDGGNHDWQATAAIDNATSPLALPGMEPASGWLWQARTINLTIENRLSAYTGPANAGYVQQAFIEKKFAGVAMHVSAVPEPSGAAAALLGLIGLAGFFSRRRKGRPT